MAKKKKGETDKRRAKAQEEKRKRRKLRLVKTRHPEPRIITRPGLPHMGAPEGFRSISMAQAMMEYAKPLMKFVENDEKGFDIAMQASMALWNYSLSVKRGEEDKKTEKVLLKTLRTAFALDKEETEALFAEMVARHRYLFPQEKQPKPGLPFMFIRKEARHLIKPFDYAKVNLSQKVFPPEQADKDLIAEIEKLDRYVQEDSDYGVYEDLFHSLKDKCQNRFEKWLVAKGVEERAQDLSFCLHTYFDFIYGYMHDDLVTLKCVPDIYFLEFFEDFLLRKMMAEPNEYVCWPPALKFFYKFLHEKEYLDNHKQIINKIDRIEPYFIEVLRKQFS